MNYPDRDQENYQEQTDHKKPVSSAQSLLLTFIQLCACVIIIAAACSLKLIGGTIYSTAASWFFDHYNNTIFVTNEEGFFPFTDSVTITESSRPYAAKPENTISTPLQTPLKDGSVTSGFGERDYNGEKQFHKGTDIAAEEGTAVCAAGDGRVVTAEENSSYGKYIVIEHNGEVKTLYAHCSALLCKKGDTIKAGTKIALVGHTGDADGAHLHFEVICEGKNIDPESVCHEISH